MVVARTHWSYFSVVLQLVLFFNSFHSSFFSLCLDCRSSYLQLIPIPTLEGHYRQLNSMPFRIFHIMHIYSREIVFSVTLQFLSSVFCYTSLSRSILHAIKWSNEPSIVSLTVLTAYFPESTFLVNVNTHVNTDQCYLRHISCTTEYIVQNGCISETCRKA